jgi:hypothetical protein
MNALAIAWTLARQLQAPHYIEEAVIEFMAVVVQTDPAAAEDGLPHLPIDNRSLPVIEHNFSETAAHLVSGSLVE